jgi:tetratricopeptide (TPR) repeat protein
LRYSAKSFTIFAPVRRVLFALHLSMEMIMRRVFALVVLAGTICVPDAALAAARSDFTTLTPSSSQMLQCNSPDPARAIIGCSALIRTGIPPVRSRSSAAALLGSDTAQADLSAVYSTRGVAYQKRGEYDLALADFNQAIRLDPKNGMALRNRGDYYPGSGRFHARDGRFQPSRRHQPEKPGIAHLACERPHAQRRF